MNMICETQCADTYQTSPEPLTCPAEEQNDVCSLEGSCRNHLSCPLNGWSQEVLSIKLVNSRIFCLIPCR